MEAAAPGGHARSRGGHGGGGSSCLACVAACRGDGRSAGRAGREGDGFMLVDGCGAKPSEIACKFQYADFKGSIPLLYFRRTLSHQSSGENTIF